MIHCACIKMFICVRGHNCSFESGEIYSNVKSLTTFSHIWHTFPLLKAVNNSNIRAVNRLLACIMSYFPDSPLPEGNLCKEVWKLPLQKINLDRMGNG